MNSNPTLPVSLACLFLVVHATAVSVDPSELTTQRAWVARVFGQTTADSVEAGNEARLASSPPFSFALNGRSSSEFLKDWNSTNLPTATPASETRVQRTRLFSDPATGLEIRMVWIEYRQFPTVEWTLFFKNTSATNSPVLSDIQALDLALGLPGKGEPVLHHQKGDDCTPDSYEPILSPMPPGTTHRFAPAGGRPTNRAFPYFNLDWQGAGLIAAVAWPGQWAATFSRDAKTKALRVQAGQELTHLVLHPGEEIRSPLIVLQFWKGNVEHAQNVWRRWMLTHNLPRNSKGELPPPMFTSCSGGFFPGLKCNEADELKFIDAFTGAGIQLDYWWMDAGWYPCGDSWPMVGTWTPDPARFPRGLKPISDRAHSKHAGLIVWFEPERVTPGTWLNDTHPEWLLGKAGETRLLNLGNETARKWLTDHVDSQLTTQGIDLYRQDFNMDPLGYWRANDAPDRQGITEVRHVEGYLAYWDELRRRHPNLVIDSCASGGRRNDLETLRRAVPLLRSDYQSFDGDPGYGPGNQGHTFGLSSWIPYYGQGVYWNERHLLYSVRSSMSQGFGFCVDIRKPGVDWETVRKIQQQWRKVARFYLADFHPLASYNLDGQAWMAWQFHEPESSEGMIQAFRHANSPFESVRLTLRDVDPTAQYAVVNLDRLADSQQLSGRVLMESGIEIRLLEKPDSAILTYSKIAKP